MNKPKAVIYVLIIITILQVGIRIYIGSKKIYFHMDEMYSYGLMNYDKLNITDNNDFQGIWHTKEYYLDYLQVNENEKWNLKQVYENQKNDVHPPLYYLLLRIFASFTINKFSKWSGIGLNIIIFTISNILVFKITKKLIKSNMYGIIGVIINGFSLIALNTNSYIRMYELANLMTLCITWFHLKIYQKEYISWLDVISITIFFVIGGLTHYYVLVYGLGIYIVYTIKCIRNKQKNNLLKYQMGIIASGICFLSIFPYSIHHVFFSYRGISREIKTDIKIQFLRYLCILNKEVFGNILGELICIIICIYNKPKQKKNDNILLFIPIILYFCVIILKAPYIEVRYFMPIYGIINIYLLYKMQDIFKRIETEKQTIIIIISLYCIILCSPIIRKTKLDFTYEEYKTLIQKIQQECKTIVYVADWSDNRFLDDLYLFTLVDKSIVVDEEHLTLEILNNENILLICKENYIQEFSDKFQYSYSLIQNLNAYNVYEIGNK